jgi:hypothetical protein
LVRDGGKWGINLGLTAFDLFSLGKLGFNVACNGLNLLRRGCFVAGTPVQVLASREAAAELSDLKLSEHVFFRQSAATFANSSVGLGF